MKHSLLILFSLLLLPITVFGWDWTVKYDMKKSDGSYEFVELSVPLVEGNWELPNQMGDWICSVHRRDYDTHTGGSLQCYQKKEGTMKMLTSMMGCNLRDTKRNDLGVNYPSDTKGVPNTVIGLKCSS